MRCESLKSDSNQNFCKYGIGLKNSSRVMLVMKWELESLLDLLQTSLKRVACEK